MNKFTNLDIMELPRSYAEECDLCYTDPPWEQGMVSMFETWLHKQGLPRPGNKIDAILTRLFTHWDAPKPIYVEYSVKGHERVIEHGVEAGHDYSYTRHCLQTNGKPYVIVCFNVDKEIGEGFNGWQFFNEVLTLHKPERVWEPFAGVGQHTKRILAAGSQVNANEINPERFQKLINQNQK